MIATGLLLLKRAGLKRTSGQLVEYDPSAEEETRRRFALSQQLYKALLNREISVAFQPQIDLINNRIVGAEILARWTRPDGSVVLPADFIPLAEANGLIVPWVSRSWNRPAALSGSWTKRDFQRSRLP